MKKFIVGVSFIISFFAILGFIHQPAQAATCSFITPNPNSLSGIEDGSTITLTTATVPTLSGRIELGNECFNGGTPPSIRASVAVKVSSEIYTAKTPYTDLFVTLGGGKVNDVYVCSQKTVIKNEGDTAEWSCVVNVWYTQSVNGNDTGTALSFTKKEFTVTTKSKEVETFFNGTTPRITFSSVGVPNDGKCEIDNMDARTYNGTSTANVFTLGEDAVFPASAFGRMFFNTTLGCIDKMVYIKVYVSKQTSSGGPGVPPSYTTKLISESKTKISQPSAYADFKPLYFSTQFCTENAGSPDTSGSRSFSCTLNVKADSNETGLFNKNERSVTYTIVIPKNIKPEDVILNPVVTSTNIGGGVSVSQFGSNTIKEGFAWDPCYDPKTKKMITYLDLANPKQIPLKELSPKQMSDGLNECYTLLSGLPIKLAGSDPVSAKIGYLEARDKDGKVLPGIFKTVIVGKFFVGDFVSYLFKLFVGIFALFAVAALIYVGIMIASNKENPVKLKVLKEWLGRIFLGIGIVLGSYIILSIIDPNLTELGFGVNNFNLSEQGFQTEEELQEYEDKGGKFWGAGGIGVAGRRDSDNISKHYGDSTGCTNKNCYADKTYNTKLAAGQLYNINAGAQAFGITNVFKYNIRGNTVDKAMGESLMRFIKATQDAGIPVGITEAFPPGSTAHNSTCHYVGTCVDVSFLNNGHYSTPMNIKKIMEMASANGFVAVYEDRTMDVDELMKLGIPRSNLLKQFEHHFSIYMSK